MPQNGEQVLNSLFDVCTAIPPFSLRRNWASQWGGAGPADPDLAAFRMRTRRLH